MWPWPGISTCATNFPKPSEPVGGSLPSCTLKNHFGIILYVYYFSKYIYIFTYVYVCAAGHVISFGTCRESCRVNNPRTTGHAGVFSKTLDLDTVPHGCSILRSCCESRPVGLEPLLEPKFGESKINIEKKTCVIYSRCCCQVSSRLSDTR